LVENEDDPLFEICVVCHWQYDLVAHKYPHKIIGANHISLDEARENYVKYGVSKRQHIGKDFTRDPLPDELPENNT